MPQFKDQDESELSGRKCKEQNIENDTSLWRKLFVPCSILVVASLVCLSQLQLAFETRYEYHYKVKDIKEDGDGETYSYNMWKGVQSLYNDGAPVLAAVVLVWSGIFPYIKLILIGIVDYLSRTKNSAVSKRWSIISVLAKWSFLDVWIVAITVLCVRIDISEKKTILDWKIFKEKLHLSIWTQAVALWGCLYFAAALVMSQLLGHYVIQRALKLKKRQDYNTLPQVDNVDEGDNNLTSFEPQNKTWQSLMMRSKTSTTQEKSKSSFFFWFITIASILSFVGLLLGVSLPFLHLEYHFNLDIKQWIIDSNINSEIIQTYSIMSACYIMAVPNHIGGENKGMSFITLMFVVFAPLLRSFLGIVLWFIPLNKRVQKYLACSIEYLSVVSGAEVFGVTSFIMIWQLPLMFKHMEEAAKYMQLDLSSLIGLKLFTLAGFLDTFVSHSIHKYYLAAAGFEE